MEKAIDNIKVSIIITCYNYSDYVVDAIKSAETQTHKSIEIIVVDDGSTDGSDEAIRNYMKDTSEEILFFKQKNSGPSAARNLGLLKSKGEYIVFLDADDYLDRDYVHSNLEFAVTNKLDIVYNNFRLFGGHKGYSDFPRFNKEMLLFTNYINVSALISRKVLSKCSFDKELNRLRFDDWELFLNAIWNNGFNAELNPKTFLNYRVTQSSRSHSASIDKNIKAYRYVTGKYRTTDKSINHALGSTDFFIKNLELINSENIENIKEISRGKTRAEELERSIKQLESIKQRQERLLKNPLRYVFWYIKKVMIKVIKKLPKILNR